MTPFTILIGVRTITPFEVQEIPAASPTLAARLTARGRGAVAVVGVLGPLALDAVRACWSHADRSPSDAFDRPWSPDVSHRPYFGLFRLDAETADEVVVYWRLPETVEIDCHGGEQASSRILDTLVSHGAAVVDGLEWESLARRAEIPYLGEMSDFDDYQPSPLVRELFFDGADALASKAHTELAAQFACDQPIVWREYFSELTNQLRALTSSTAGASADLSRFWSIPRASELRPYLVALTGAPNAGKSSLLNAIVGYDRAVASPESGATRDLVGATYVYGGWEFHAVDCAGLRRTEDEIESAGVALAADLARRADVVVELFDPTVSRASQELTFSEYLDESDVRTPGKGLNVRIPALNKSDLPSSAFAEDWRDGSAPSSEDGVLRLSARSGAGIDTLLKKIYCETFESEFGNRISSGRCEPLIWSSRQSDFLRQLQQLCSESRYSEALETLTK